MLPSLRTTVEAHGLLAKKALGQNFLLDRNITGKIIRLSLNAQNLSDYRGAAVYEVGPGPGGLTREILRAELMKPKTTAAQVKQFLADCLNIKAEQLDENTRIDLMLPADFKDYNFYLTVLNWCRQRFGKFPDKDLISKGTVRDLIAFFSDE